jgi:hypothetical protein
MDQTVRIWDTKSGKLKEKIVPGVSGTSAGIDTSSQSGNSAMGSAFPGSIGTVVPVDQNLSQDHYKRVADELLQIDIDLIDANSRLQIELGEPVDAEWLAAQIKDEFKNDSQVTALLKEVKSIKEAIDRSRQLTQGRDPARVAMEERLAKLNREYNGFWNTRSEEIRRRLLEQRKAHSSDQSVTDLKKKVEVLRLTKAKLTELLQGMNKAASSRPTRP